ncbi:MAG: GLPGLI family protein [Bacteroidota bacterium]
MKCLPLILPFIFFCHFTVDAQTQEVDYTIFYNFTYITDTTQNTYSEPEEYMLFKYKNESRFINMHAHHNDSLETILLNKLGARANTQEGANEYIQAVGKERKKHISDLRLIKDFKSHIATILLYNTSETKCMEVAIDLKWDLLNETQIIAGQVCSKATTHYGGRLYTAWYTTEIPIPDGPYVFNGLPGLILKVVDSKGWYSFTINDMILKSTKRYIDQNFVRKKYLKQLDRPTYIIESTAQKENPKVVFGLPDPSGERLARLKERRKNRYDLLIEQ